MAHDHTHSHDHSHAHGGAHAHMPKHFGPAFALAAALNFAMVAAQVIYGLSAHSVALLADAGHNFGDGLGLLIAWGAHVLAKKPPTAHYTYGFRAVSIHSALINAVLLLVATGAIVLEALRRFGQPEEIDLKVMMIVAAGAVVANGLAAWLLMAAQKGDLNIRAAFAHMVADAAVSAGVVVAGAAILVTGWVWLDPAMSLVISAVIVWGTWGMLAESAKLSVDAVPSQIDPGEVRRYLAGQKGVASVHDLHIWAISTTENALSAHLVIPDGHPGDNFLAALCRGLDKKFAINHPTIQIETGEGPPCPLAPEHKV